MWAAEISSFATRYQSQTTMCSRPSWCHVCGEFQTTHSSTNQCRAPGPRIGGSSQTGAQCSSLYDAFWAPWLCSDPYHPQWCICRVLDGFNRTSWISSSTFVPPFDCANARQIPLWFWYEHRPWLFLPWHTCTPNNGNILRTLRMGYLDMRIP